MKITTEIAKTFLENSEEWLINDDLEIRSCDYMKGAYPYIQGTLSLKLENKKWFYIRLKVLDVIFQHNINIELYERLIINNKSFFESNFFENAICDDFEYFIKKAFRLPLDQAYYVDVFVKENSNRVNNNQKERVIEAIQNLLVEYIEYDSISSSTLEQYHINFINNFEAQK